MRTTPEDIKRMAAVMLAAAEGKEIQCRAEGWGGAWTAVREPSWDWTTYDYRVKPRPIEGWVNVYEDDRVGLHPTKAMADASASSGRIKCVFVREVEA